MRQPDASIRLDLAIAALRRGGLLAYPTEAVWGLGCDPRRAASVRRLLALKRRDPSKGLILVGAHPEQFSPWLQALPEQLRQQLLDSWPGPVTWVVPNHGIAGRWITGAHPGCALRVSAHPMVAALCRRFGGPLVSTSANPAGRPPARSALQVRRYFGAGIDYLLAGELGSEQRPSRILDAVSGQELRAG